MKTINIIWFRRDLRLTDHTALFHALQSHLEVLPIFIFDDQILNDLPNDDPRVSFIYQSLKRIHHEFEKHRSSLNIFRGKPLDVWTNIISTYKIDTVFVNKDYEPYALARDRQIAALLAENGIKLMSFKDQVIFEESEVLKDDGKPYTVFTPYMKKWRALLNEDHLKPYAIHLKNLCQPSSPFPSIEEIGFKVSTIQVLPYQLEQLQDYTETRNFPALDSTSYLSPHLRFGTIGIRELMHQIPASHTSFVNELIWREFFMQILYHFPQVVQYNFKKKYDAIQWRNNEEEFKKWCDGETGYPMVDAGMRQLNQTGYMHNRVRMVVASFLCKHLLIDWRWGEAYFADKLLDFELSSNNGNWQWAAGTGCDAAPYFRVFNPSEQLKKFDPKMEYVRKWVPEIEELNYQPMVDHKFARERALRVYKEGLGG
jgi:deoxyribodipyrimidine photo-lyase